uniref:Uncharacterized protein n=1 Tax=virus sp. ctBM815 TaxID=2825806 RepID=A0A8S5RK86_9VIRU|nr:MAG TPA: hypothetical protein [virus sp. ctBM815]DAV23980.1 MAG TPA: hypothetical protein [Bacteriophage sp.]
MYQKHYLLQANKLSYMLIFPFLLFISLNTEHSAIKVICKCG